MADMEEVQPVTIVQQDRFSIFACKVFARVWCYPDIPMWGVSSQWPFRSDSGQYRDEDHREDSVHVISWLNDTLIRLNILVWTAC